VIEMDAASNNSVDDIRELRESVAFAPVSGRHKVYILDEAHMLSTAAWNAFLKTLEEPPPSTIFVLATTEAQKVPATVVDRCHRFDFHRPTVEQIAAVVRRAAAAESIEIPPPAVAAIARSATGSFRDALGTLEQLVTYSGPTIALDDVLAVLGVADAELLTEAFDAIAAGDARRALLCVHSAMQSGRDAAAFASDLETRARELMVTQTLGAVPAELSVTPELDASLQQQSQRVSRAAVVRVLELLAGAQEAVKAGAEPRTQLELALVKAATPDVDASTRALLARVERLEQALAGGGALAPAPQPPAPAAAAPEPDPAAAPAPTSGEELADAPRPPAPAGAAAVSASGSAPVPVPAAAEVAGAVAVAEAPPADLDSLSALWPALVEEVRSENALLSALIADARPVTLSGGELTVAFSSQAAFLKKKADGQGNREAVAEALRRVTGQRLTLVYELRDDLGPATATVAPTEEDLVARFVTEFDAEELPAPHDEPGPSQTEGE
jgi:DNA polymerase-3 subunit gamma/tau